MNSPLFLNVDLEIESKSKLDSLIVEFGKDVMVLHSGPAKVGYFLSVASSKSHKGPDAAIRALCVIVDTLSPRGRRQWIASHRKEFDIGYELLPSERGLRFTLRSDTLRRVAALGASLAVTYYPPDKSR